ncbi:MAG: type II toxin-antitoxin system VapC family toxin [Angustibacter sp.]
MPTNFGLMSTPQLIKVFLTVTGKSRGLVDTNIIIHLPRLDTTGLPDELVVSAITLAELTAGSHYAVDPITRAKRASLAQYTESVFEALPFNIEAARAFGIVSAAVLAHGRSPRGRTADLMIASVALAHQLPLYTTNPKDFFGLNTVIQLNTLPCPF